jgi:hypothetical protein
MVVIKKEREKQSVFLKYSYTRKKLTSSKTNERQNWYQNIFSYRYFVLFFYQICNKVIFFKMLPFLQPEIHLHTGYSLAHKLVLLYILLHVEEILPSGKSPRIINLNFRQ